MLGTQLTNWTGKGRLRLTEVVIRWLTIQLVQREDSSCRSFNLEIPSWNPFIPTTTMFRFQERTSEVLGIVLSLSLGRWTAQQGLDAWASGSSCTSLLLTPQVTSWKSYIVMNEFEETHDIGFQILYSSLHRTQSGKTCSVDKNNQSSGPAGNTTKKPAISPSCRKN